MTHHRTSSGNLVAIPDMNDYHLHNAIKKLRSQANLTMEQAEHLTALNAEQGRRGGPPKPKES